MLQLAINPSKPGRIVSEALQIGVGIPVFSKPVNQVIIGHIRNLLAYLLADPPHALHAVKGFLFSVIHRQKLPEESCQLSHILRHELQIPLTPALLVPALDGFQQPPQTPDHRVKVNAGVV
jgi:hypothetical protein